GYERRDITPTRPDAAAATTGQACPYRPRRSREHTRAAGSCQRRGATRLATTQRPTGCLVRKPEEEQRRRPRPEAAGRRAPLSGTQCPGASVRHEHPDHAVLPRAEEDLAVAAAIEVQVSARGRGAVRCLDELVERDVRPTAARVLDVELD